MSLSAPTIDSDGLPPSIKRRIARGRQEMLKDAPKRRLCQKFEKGDSYFYLTNKGHLSFQSSGQTPNPGAPRPPHRIRNQYNFIRPIVAGKVSTLTQRIPSYEILPSTTDPEDVQGARFSELVALYGYDKWFLRAKVRKVVGLGIGGGGEGFLVPYFDANVGPYTKHGDDVIGQGEIKVRALDGNAVMWEPGVEFYESSWWATEDARPIDEVEALPGFFGDPLVSDASTADVPTDQADSDGLVMVTEYFERPSPKNPMGMRAVVANGRPIIDNRVLDPGAGSMFEPYPCRGPKGEILDDPIIFRWAWEENTDGSRDLGLTWQMIDAQRTLQDCYNKFLEWKNRVLNPRVMAPTGSRMQPRTDEPGGIDWFELTGNQGAESVPRVEDVQTAFAAPLFQMIERMQQDMRVLGFDAELQAEANVAARTVQAVVEQMQARFQTALASLADFHARVMRRCLQLVANHYTEERKLAIAGRFGPEVKSFDGAALRGQVDVRVLPGSLEYLSRDQVTQRVIMFADRGWVSPQQAMLAINSGTSDSLIQSVELDLAKIDRIIQRIRDGSVMEMPEQTQMETDPATGQAQMREVPGWMPMDLVDNVSVWRARLADWMKTTEFESLPLDRQEPAKLIITSLEQLEIRAAQRKAEQQAAEAAQIGMRNAAKPGQSEMPTMPGGEDRSKTATGLPQGFDGSS